MKKIRRKIFLAVTLLGINLTGCFAMTTETSSLKAENLIKTEYNLENYTIKDLNDNITKMLNKHTKDFNEIGKYGRFAIDLELDFNHNIESLKLHKIFSEDNDIFNLNVIDNNTLSKNYENFKKITPNYININEFYNKCENLLYHYTRELKKLNSNLNRYLTTYNFPLQIDISQNVTRTSEDEELIEDIINKKIEINRLRNDITKYTTYLLNRINSSQNDINTIMEPIIRQLKIQSIIHELRISPYLRNFNLEKHFDENIKKEVKNIIKKIIKGMFKRNAPDIVKLYFKNSILKLYASQLKLSSCFYEKEKENENKIKDNENKIKDIKIIIYKLFKNVNYKDLKNKTISLIKALYVSTYKVLSKLQYEKNKEIKNLKEKTNKITKKEYNIEFRNQRKFLLDSKRILKSIKEFANTIKTAYSLEDEQDLKKYEQSLEDLADKFQNNLYCLSDFDVDFNDDFTKEEKQTYTNFLNQVENELNNIKVDSKKLKDFIARFLKIIYNINITEKYDGYKKIIMHDFLESLDLSDAEKKYLAEIFERLKTKIYEKIKSIQNDNIENCLNNINLSNTFKDKNSHKSIMEHLNYIIDNIDNVKYIEKCTSNKNIDSFQKKIEENNNFCERLDFFLENFIYPELKSIKKFIKNNKNYKKNKDAIYDKFKTSTYITYLKNKLKSIIEKCYENIEYKNNKNLNEKEKQILKNELTRLYKKSIKLLSKKILSISKHLNIKEIFKKEYDEYQNNFEIDRKIYDKNDDIYTLQPFVNLKKIELNKTEPETLLETYKQNAKDLKKTKTKISDSFQNFQIGKNTFLPKKIIKYDYEQNYPLEDLPIRNKNIILEKLPNVKRNKSLPQKITKYPYEKYNPATEILNKIMARNDYIPEEIIKDANEKQNKLCGVTDQFLRKIKYLIEIFEIFYTQEDKNNNRLNNFTFDDKLLEFQSFQIQHNTLFPADIDNKTKNEIIKYFNNCIQMLCKLKLKEISSFYQKNKEELKSIMLNIRKNLEEIFINKYKGNPEDLIEILYDIVYDTIKTEIKDEEFKLNLEKYKFEIDKKYNGRLNPFLIKDQKELYSKIKILTNSIKEIEEITKEITKNTFKKESLKKIKQDLENLQNHAYENLLECKNLHNSIQSNKKPEEIKIFNKILGITPSNVIKKAT